MSSVNRRRSTSTNANASSGNTRTRRTSGSGNSSSTRRSSATPEVRSARRTKLPKVKVDGLSRAPSDMQSYANRSMYRGGYTASISEASGTGRVGTGYIEVGAKPTADGMAIKIDSFHNRENEKLNIFLQAEVFDPKTKEMQTVTLTMLAVKELFNKTGYRGSKTFTVSYDDLNKYLKKHHKNLQVTPGRSRLFVSAVWDSSNHRAGGPGRGAFYCPLPTKGGSAVATNIAALTGTAGAKVKADDIPLDMAVKYPGTLRQSQRTLEKDGHITTRLESEFKGNTTNKDLTFAVNKAYELAELTEKKKKAELAKILGKDWEVQPVDRHYMRDASGKVKTDSKGWPVLDPMKDEYMDDDKLSMTKHNGAVRLRTNEQKGGVFNIKPGGGKTDKKTGITQRVEVGYALQPGATADDVRKLLTALDKDTATNQWRETIFNHGAREVRKLDKKIKLAKTLDPWLKVTQKRHKFTVRNTKTGVEVELSLDFVEVKTVRKEHEKNGKPQKAKFCVVEAELDHLQITSSNTAEAAAASTFGAFLNDKDQSDWLSKASPQATLDTEPRLHQLEDLENPGFRNTSSYKAFEAINEKLMGVLFPNGLKPSRQKAAQAAEILGIMTF